MGEDEGRIRIEGRGREDKEGVVRRVCEETWEQTTVKKNFHWVHIDYVSVPEVTENLKSYPAMAAPGLSMERFVFFFGFVTWYYMYRTKTITEL